MNPFDAYFYPIFGSACLVSTVAAFLAARRQGVLIPSVLLGVGILSFWAGLFIGSDLGYRAWQSMPDPPPDAFSDALPLGALIAGWFPGAMFCGVIFCTLRLFVYLRPKAVTSESSPSATEPLETGNPYQGPQ